MFKQLKVYYILISLPFVLLLSGSVIFLDAIKLTITRNPHPQINYTIFTIILVGGTLILVSAFRLLREARVLVEFSRAIHSKADSATLRKMTAKYTVDIACLLQMVASSGNRSISHQEQVAIEHELINARARLVRRNALPQYLTGLLVGMGLLGTFIGLLATLNDISVLISSFADIDMQNASPLLVFRTMIERMKAPMQSMGIAFSASMFGLLGSIILGLMMVGIRRLQGDIFSLLSSEVARHIETALSFESVSFRAPAAATGEAVSGDATTNILLRIEERLAEAGRQRQRALAAEIDDFKKQRADMLHALTEQNVANNNFRGELQQLGRQFDAAFTVLGKGTGEIATQLSELTVHLAGTAQETHKLLNMQVDEQRQSRALIDAHQIEERERLAEAARLQQRALAAEIDDFQNQRADMLRALVEQTEAGNGFRQELQQLGTRLGTIFDSMENGNGEISAQISELTVHLAADARETHILLNHANNTFRQESQQLGDRLTAILNSAENGTATIDTQISTLASRLAADADKSSQFFASANSALHERLQQLGIQLDTILNATETGNEAVRSKVSEVIEQLATGVKESQQIQRDTQRDLSQELQQLRGQLDTIAQTTDTGDQEICSRISALVPPLAAAIEASQRRLEETQGEVCTTLQQLGRQLETLAHHAAHGTQEICNRFDALTEQRAPEPPATEPCAVAPETDADALNDMETTT
ncbi:MAG: hypothetical protein K0A93_11825 [Desulfuromonadaceae bacterium]|nr:hypothetical protein [Desulfuromonadaceae bacterium]